MSSTRNQTLGRKLMVDGAMTGAILMLLTLALTGLAIHEWMGIALLILVTIHLLLNWPWIITGLRRFNGRLPPLVRFNAILNSLLFVMMTVVLASGLMISAVALPFFGLRMIPSIFLRLVHQVTADGMLVVVGIHLGMNWRAVVTAVRKIVAARSGQGNALQRARLP